MDQRRDGGRGRGGRGGRGRRSGMSGREIGLYYANLSQARKKEKEKREVSPLATHDNTEV